MISVCGEKLYGLHKAWFETLENGIENAVCYGCAKWTKCPLTKIPLQLHGWTWKHPSYPSIYPRCRCLCFFFALFGMDRIDGWINLSSVTKSSVRSRHQCPKSHWPVFRGRLWCGYRVQAQIHLRVSLMSCWPFVPPAACRCCRYTKYNRWRTDRQR